MEQIWWTNIISQMCLYFSRDLVMCVCYVTVANRGFQIGDANRFFCSTFGLDMGARTPVPPLHSADLFNATFTKITIFSIDYAVHNGHKCCKIQLKLPRVSIRLHSLWSAILIGCLISGGRSLFASRYNHGFKPWNFHQTLF